MKKILVGLMIITGAGLNAQTLTNTDFETWSITQGYAPDTLPVNWYAMYCYTAHQSTDAFQGSYATRLQGYFACGIAPGILVNGSQPAGYGNIIEGGTPFTSKPAAISGFYKYTDVTAGDSAEVTIILKKFNTSTMKHDTIGIGVQALPASAAYTMYTVNMNYLLPTENPDSIIIMFNSSKHYKWDEVTMALPSLYIDRIMLPGNVAAGINNNIAAVLRGNAYPNPSNGITTIELYGGLDNFSGLQFSVFDASGKKIRESSVRGNVIVVDGLSEGNYLYVISDGQNLLLKGKILVQ
ncbi:MAG TPA: T9SS type A sorting domain-containing protein [Bacteroidia bacterium]|jgi:hypothetical protein